MNSFGNHFRFTSFGESHGAAVGGVIDGCPSGLTIDFDLIRQELSRRRGDGIPGTTPRKEADEIEFLSGIFEGKTIGTPIAFLIRNRDVRSQDYEVLKDLYRPGHGDYTWQQKYGTRDYRGGGRCSARETASRVVAGAIAKQILLEKGIKISSSVEVSETRGNRGGIISCEITGAPVGMGEPIFDRLQAQLAHAMLSIPSATGFEFGEGFRAAQMSGEEYRDCFNADFTTKTNHCGGLMGGLSNGMPIRFRVAFHPVISQGNDLPCVDHQGNEHIIQLNGRHDSNHVPRAAVIIEAMAALVLVNNLDN